MLVKLSLKNIDHTYLACLTDARIVLLPKYVKEIIHSSRRQLKVNYFSARCSE